jgi:hypothetical protein
LSVRALLFAGAISALFGACSEPPVDTAENRAAAFVNAILNQDANEFWTSLDRPSRAYIAAKAGIDPAAKDAPEKALLTERFRPLYALKPISAAKTKVTGPDAATVEIEALSGEKMPLSLVREDGVWRVHLSTEAAPESAPAPPSAPASTPSSASAPSSAKTPTP